MNCVQAARDHGHEGRSCATAVRVDAEVLGGVRKVDQVAR